MQGISVKIPLTSDPVDGLYSMNKTKQEAIKQDFKMLLLTNPGERIMYPQYGVGIRTFLFSQMTDDLKDTITNKITEQVLSYMRFLQIEKVDILEEAESNFIKINIHYSIPYLKSSDVINLNLQSN